MPRDNSIKSVLVIGSGPIVIGQACEFDYSGTQACRILKSEGIRVILVNSNPATIMTDPEFADATYIEPITPEFLEQVIAKERPSAILATLGGQTALNAAIGLHEKGILTKYQTKLIGADVDAIRRAARILQSLHLLAGLIRKEKLWRGNCDYTVQTATILLVCFYHSKTSLVVCQAKHNFGYIVTHWNELLNTTCDTCFACGE